MKRKIFSKLLMGAFLFASVSAFVSCKDYDDDINANKADIKAVQEQLATLTSNLTSLKSQVEAQKTALEQELATAKSQLETQIATAKAELNAAIEKKADQTTVDGLATKVATLETNLSALKAAYEAKIAALDSALASLQALIDKKADITYVDNAIATLQSVLEGKIAIVDQNKVSKDDFNAFKTEVAALQSALETLKTLANGKADQKDVDNAVEKINEKIAALQKQMETVVPQSALEKMSETITGIRSSIDALSQTIAAKANQSALDELSARVDANYKELKAQANALVTPEQLAEAIATLKSEIETKYDKKNADLEQAIADLEEALNKKIDGVAETADKNLADAVETINAALGTKANVTDLEKAVADFNAAKDSITLDIATKYAAVTGDIKGINKTLGEIQEALKTKAAQSDLEELGEAFATFVILQGVTNGELDNRLIACEALIEQVAAINAFLGELEEGATLAGKLAALKEQMSKEAQDALDEEIGKREKAIEDVNDAIADLEEKLTGEIEAANAARKTLEEKLYGVEGEENALGDIVQLQKDFSQIDEKIQTGIDANLANLKVFVQKMLTSITLIPQLYIDGIEAIQFVSVQYTPQVFDRNIKPGRYQEDNEPEDGWYIKNGEHFAWYTLGHHQLKNVARAVPIRVDNKQTEAYYRVSPSVVKEEDIDIEKIKYACTTAKTETRGAEIKDNNPVKPTFESLENGVLTVKLTKTVNANTSLTFGGEGTTANIASLMVPRKENKETGAEYKEIYSEFNLIDEITISPVIAALNRKDNPDASQPNYAANNYVFNGNTWWTKHDSIRPMQYHFIDSLQIWSAQVDRDVYVKEYVQYNEPFDLLKLVTGCYDVTVTTPNGDVTKHVEITKEQLAQYGIAFRFFKPTTAYGEENQWGINYNYTDQQKFAKIEGSMISATLPSGTFGNRAVIGKEPIVRVMLVDTVRNNLLDQAYFKVKFVDNTPKKPAIDVTFETKQQLDCENNRMKVRWDAFIEKVYAIMEGSYGTGLSWQEFRQVYPAADVIRDNMKFNVDDETDTGSVMETWQNRSTDSPIDQDRLGSISIWWLSGGVNTESPAADANELWWDLNADDIGNITNQPNRQKIVKTTFTFVSNRPTDYGNINVTLVDTIYLPNAELSFYQNYWYNPYEAHYVLPVQYNTKAYYDQLIGATANNEQYDPANIRDDNEYTDEEGNEGAYCVYNNNLFNAFTFNQDETSYYYKSPIKSIAKYNCATWDFQFRLSQSIAGVAGAWPQYRDQGNNKTTEPQIATIGTEGKYNFGTQYKEDLSVSNKCGALYGAYNLMTLNKAYNNVVYKDAIWMNWYNDVDEKNPGITMSTEGSWSWCTAESDEVSRPYLFADHFNPYNQILINPIKSKGIGAAPEFTDGKKIKMGMFIAWNEYNVELVKSYDIALVAPLDIQPNLNGYFEEGLVSGSFVNCAGAFTMVDFRGYEVAEAPLDRDEIAAAKKAGIYEFCQYRDRLFDYYECSEPIFDLTKVKYGMKKDASGNVVVDPTVTVDNVANNGVGLTADQIFKLTNGNVALSIEQINPDGDEDTQWLRFKNNGGSNVSGEVGVFIPATMTYGFGTITTYVRVPLYPRGEVPAENPAGARRR